MEEMQSAPTPSGIKPEFRAELESLINRHSMESGSNTPDFILSAFLADSLEACDKAITHREGWYGRVPPDAPGAVKTAPTQPESHASKVLYPAIQEAMNELDQLPATFNYTVNRAFNILHRAFWSECPAPASVSPLRTNLGEVSEQ